jgi:hypothetical protein
VKARVGAAYGPTASTFDFEKMVGARGAWSLADETCALSLLSSFLRCLRVLLLIPIVESTVLRSSTDPINPERSARRSGSRFG